MIQFAHFFPIKPPAWSFIHPSYLSFIAFLSTILSTAQPHQVQSNLLGAFQSMRDTPKTISHVPQSTHSSLLIELVMGCALERERHKDVLGRTGSPPLSLYLSHLNKGKDGLAGKATPTHAFSRSRSWHACQHMGEKMWSQSTVVCFQHSLRWGKVSSLCVEWKSHGDEPTACTVACHTATRIMEPCFFLCVNKDCDAVRGELLEILFHGYEVLNEAELGHRGQWRYTVTTHSASKFT